MKTRLPVEDEFFVRIKKYGYGSPEDNFIRTAVERMSFVDAQEDAKSSMMGRRRVVA